MEFDNTNKYPLIKLENGKARVTLPNREFTEGTMVSISHKNLRKTDEVYVRLNSILHDEKGYYSIVDYRELWSEL